MRGQREAGFGSVEQLCERRWSVGCWGEEADAVATLAAWASSSGGMGEEWCSPPGLVVSMPESVPVSASCWQMLAGSAMVASRSDPEP